MIHRLVKHKDSHSEEIWLTIYGDLITNLVLLFLALYGLTVMGDQAMADAIASMSGKNIAALKTIQAGNSMDDVAQMLKSKFKFNPDVIISLESDVVRIEFGEQVLFRSGGATVKSSAVPVLKDIAAILKDSPQTVIVEGHTDSVPLKAGGTFKDNWELSLARSMSVVRLLSDEGWLPSAQMAAAAYGAYRPRASNITANGRRLNRRVEIALFKDFPFDPEGGSEPALPAVRKASQEPVTEVTSAAHP